MKKGTGAFLVLSAMFLVVGTALAQEAKWEECKALIERMDYYNEHIDMKIKAAELDAAHLGSPYEDIRCMAKKSKMEAEFYKDHRLELIKEMIKEDLKPKDFRVHLFLARAFEEAHPEALDMCRK